MKKLTRSTTDKKVCGVCGGIAKYFDWDSNIVRIIAIIAILPGGVGLIAYLACALLLPEDTAANNSGTSNTNSNSNYISQGSNENNNEGSGQ